jgi:hypothetical protein
LFAVPTVLLFLVAQFFQAAVEADAVVATDHFTAFRAFPRFFLFFQEFRHALFFDGPQILYHAHSVSRLVSGIESFEPGAWEVVAFETEDDFAI